MAERGAAAVAPLLAAKRTLPPRRPGVVPRARLHERLTGATTRLIAVVAPAGWGKTTLLAEWAHDPAEHRPVAWVSLDQADDEPGRFWSYVLTALQATVPAVGPAPLAALAAPGLAPVDLALPTLLNELEAAGDAQHLLVLDDYHVLSDRRIHEGVEFVLSYLPPSLRLVVAGRADPPLPLARLRARGELTDVRSTDLRFTDDEAAALVSAVGGVGMDAATAGTLRERTEGWAAGLQLAALSVRGSAAPAEAVAAIRGDDRHILDYFSAEVLDRLPAEHRDLLVRASVLERLSGPLCDAALDRTGSARVLAELDRADLFVVPLDERHEWYRCHHLFRDALRRELELAAPAELSAVLSRAAHWYLAEGYVEEAIRHHLAAGDAALAMELLRSSAPTFVARGAAATYLQLGDLAQDAVTDPRLCLNLSFTAGLSGRWDRLSAWVAAADRLIVEDSPPLDGWRSLRAALLATRAGYCYPDVADTAAAVADAEAATALEPDPASFGFVITRAALGAVLNDADRSADALAVLAPAWAAPALRAVPPMIVTQTAGQYALALLRAGRAEEAGRVCQQAAPVAAAIERAWGEGAGASVSRLRTVEGRLAHRAGDVTAAVATLERAARMARVWGEGTYFIDALVALAEARLAAGDAEGARRALSVARETADSEEVRLIAGRELAAAESRAGRGAARAARRAGRLVEELTDRELAVLRMLSGPATQREIGGALYLSLNTVKGYTKSLYRKLDVPTRAAAVERARELGLL